MQTSQPFEVLLVEDDPSDLQLTLHAFENHHLTSPVRGNSQSRNIPFVVLPSSREDRDLAECYNLGVNRYLVKPVDFTLFDEVVRQLGFYWLLLNQPPSG